MFSKSRINEPGPKTGGESDLVKPAEPAKPAFDYALSTPKSKPAPATSVLKTEPGS